MFQFQMRAVIQTKYKTISCQAQFTEALIQVDLIRICRACILKDLFKIIQSVLNNSVHYQEDSFLAMSIIQMTGILALSLIIDKIIKILHLKPIRVDIVWDLQMDSSLQLKEIRMTFLLKRNAILKIMIQLVWQTVRVNLNQFKIIIFKVWIAQKHQRQIFLII